MFSNALQSIFIFANAFFELRKSSISSRKRNHFASGQAESNINSLEKASNLLRSKGEAQISVPQC